MVASIMLQFKVLMASDQVLAGFHAIQGRLKQAPETIRCIYVDQKRRDRRLQSLLDRAHQLGCKTQQTSADHLQQLVGKTRHQGVVALAVAHVLATSVEEVLDRLEAENQQPLLLVLDGITDPHNLGACLRTADAAGAHALIAPRDQSASLQASARRVASGAADHIPYLQVTNLARTLRYLKDRDIWVVGTDDQAASSLFQSDARRPLAWVLGAEGKGMRRLTRDTCDELVQIPMMGSVESLNVSVATAVCLYETVRQRQGL